MTKCQTVPKWSITQRGCPSVNINNASRLWDRTKIWRRLPVNQSYSYEKIKPPMEKLTKLHATHFLEQAISANKQHLRLPALNLQKASLFLVKALKDSARLVDMMTKYHGRFQSEAPPLKQLVYSLASMYIHIHTTSRDLSPSKKLAVRWCWSRWVDQYYSHGDDDVVDQSSCSWIFPKTDPNEAPSKHKLKYWRLLPPTSFNAQWRVA